MILRFSEARKQPKFGMHVAPFQEFLYNFTANRRNDHLTLNLVASGTFVTNNLLYVVGE